MKSMIACLLVLAVAANAQFFDYGYGLGGYPGYFPYTGVRSAVYPTTYQYGYPSYSASQYHAQDELGQASYGYAHPGQAAANYRDAFGNQIGSYAYVNPEGKEVRVSYTADHRGFRVLSNALPEAPVAVPVQVLDTPEVAAAKQEFAAKFAAAKNGPAPVAPAAPVALPAPVQDTPEVAAAKAEFAAKFAAAKAAASAIRRKRQVFSPLAYSFPAATVPYGFAPAQPVREAVLTKTILNPGHAVAYRVD